MKVMLFSVPTYTFFETCVLFKDIFIKIRHYFSYILSIFVVYQLYHIRLIKLNGDIELHPGSKPSSLICHWKLNSITSHDFLKVKLLTLFSANPTKWPNTFKQFDCNLATNCMSMFDHFVGLTLEGLTAYNIMHKFDIISVPESYLNWDTLSSNDNLNILGHNMSRADHLPRNRRGGVSICYKESLPIKILNINYIQECISFYLIIGTKRCTNVSLYRSPRQSAHEFEIIFKQIKSGYGINYSKKSVTHSCYWRF